MNKIANFLKPSWKKVIVTFVLLILTAWSIFWIFGHFMGCNLGLACERATLIPLFSGITTAVLVIPVYFLSGIFQYFFYDWFDYLYKIHVWDFIFGFFEIVWAYILTCAILHVREVIKKW